MKNARANPDYICNRGGDGTLQIIYLTLDYSELIPYY